MYSLQDCESNSTMAPMMAPAAAPKAAVTVLG